MIINLHTTQRWIEKETHSPFPGPSVNAPLAHRTRRGPSCRGYSCWIWNIHLRSVYPPRSWAVVVLVWVRQDALTRHTDRYSKSLHSLESIPSHTRPANQGRLTMSLTSCTLLSSGCLHGGGPLSSEPMVGSRAATNGYLLSRFNQLIIFSINPLENGLKINNSSAIHKSQTRVTRVLNWLVLFDRQPRKRKESMNQIF